ncbi:beta-phosphoglucomutase family hydrolase [Ramlibacter sp. AN1015]|uniref:beta-phosphoglucomutase family hydrolase n=1 Tax=Ramlibacter sp. AN1015 TaxID=3133428 RepID=UPI0030C233CE
MSTGFGAAIFDMDGVITRTAQLHAQAWKELFDAFLQERGGAFEPFDARAEYRALVDGKPRIEGVRSFLRSRGIEPGEKEQAALAERKDAIFKRLLGDEGVKTFASTLHLVQELRERGVRTGVVTSSRHGREIVQAAGIEALFDARLDGVDLDALGLKGKPDPDMFLRCAEQLGVPAGRTLVFEDAISGVEAGRRGGFGLVVGVDRGDNAAALRHAGADVVVQDLAALTADGLEAALRQRQDTLAWHIEQEGFDRARERQMESLFAIGNGYMGLRGALDTPPPGAHCDLFIAGVYDRKRADLPYSELEFLTPGRGDDPHAELVPLPSPLRLTLTLEGEPLDFGGPHGRELRRTLDMRQGVLHVEALYETAGGRRTRVRTRRCAALTDPHLLLHEALIETENHWAAVEVRPTLRDTHAAERHPHIEHLEHLVDGELELVRYATRASGVEVCIAARALRTAEGLRRFVSVFTSRDAPDPRAAALAHVGALDWGHFDALFAGHAQAWDGFWEKADIRVPGRPSVAQALRFGAYHLRLPAGDDPRASIPARTFTGRAYEGHIFWDVEVFMLPFFLHTEPERARNLLLYRHRTLEGARRRARALGYRGACFAWESTVTGDDVTPSRIVLRSTGKEIPIFTGRQQIHVTADVAYGVWRYWEATGDEAFLAGPGAEILFETARFWASRVERGERHLHIRGVVGPDEYHHDVDDNAYTNWMARFNLERAAWVADHLHRAGAEAEEWKRVAHELHCPGPGADGVIEQFAGFFALDAYSLADEERFKAPLSRLFDWDRINRMQLIKQADVLMLPFLFPEAFSEAVVAANYRYYEPRTDHGSSLSPAVHAAIAARLELRQDAERYLKQSLWLDLQNGMDNSMLGVHPAAMGGTWQALVFGFLGVRFSADGPQPHARAGARLPAGWEAVEMSLAWRGGRHPLRVERT